MATHRRLLPLTRHLCSVLSAHSSQSQFQFQTLTLVRSLHYQNPQSNPFHSLPRFRSADFLRSRHFSFRPTESDDEEDANDEEDDEDDESDYEEEEGCNGTVRKVRVSGKSEEEKVAEAAGIGYKVVGPLGSSEMPFKPWEPVFAIVQVGSHQFKVCNGDSIFCERLKFCDVNDKLILNKVLMLGSKTQTIIGRPILPDTAVHAVVEEHALDAKVIIFKKKRRKNYRRTKGHRQELTKLRVTDIQGIDKSEAVAVAA